MEHKLPPHIQPAAMSVLDFCAAAGIGKTRFYDEVRAERIRVKKCGSRTLVPMAELTAWLDRLPSVAAA